MRFRSWSPKKSALYFNSAPSRTKTHSLTSRSLIGQLSPRRRKKRKSGAKHYIAGFPRVSANRAANRRSGSIRSRGGEKERERKKEWEKRAEGCFGALLARLFANDVDARNRRRLVFCPPRNVKRKAAAALRNPNRGPVDWVGWNTGQKKLDGIFPFTLLIISSDNKNVPSFLSLSLLFPVHVSNVFLIWLWKEEREREREREGQKVAMNIHPAPLKVNGFWPAVDKKPREGDTLKGTFK